MDDIDNAGIYALDFISQKIDDGEVKTTLVDYVRQAGNFARWNIDHFYKEMINELVAMTERLAVASEVEGTEKVWDLCHRHGKQVEKAINRMRSTHDKVYDFTVEGSFLYLVSQREYLREPIQRLAGDISKRLSTALPLAFQKNPPRDEPDFNDKVSAILNSDREKFEREHPSISFALAHTIPDHSTEKCDLLIESKYIRGSTSPSKVTDGIAADLTKYPAESYILFIVYDPACAIKDDEVFRRDFEAKGRCTVEIIR